jgi:nicotinamidase/pyrazinamidase
MVCKLLISIGLVVFVTAVYLLVVFKNISSVSIGSRIPERDQISTALMVMDIQEGITGKKSKHKRYQAQSDHLIDKANKIIKKANEANIPVIYIRFETTNWIMNLLGRGILAKNSPGIEIDKRVEIVSDHIITRDKMDAFTSVELESLLKVLNINCLDFIGLDAAYCIDRTAKAAINRGFKARVIKDAVISSNFKQLSKTLKAYPSAGIHLISASEWQGMKK